MLIQNDILGWINFIWRCCLRTLTFGTGVKSSLVGFDKIIFGCGHDNNQGFLSPKSVGIIGLGNGATSLTSQLGYVIGNKFSYCLALESNIPSLLNFGEKVVVSGSEIVSTPIVSGHSSTPYYINLKGMTVAVNLYTKLESLVAAQINLERVTDKNLLPSTIKLCYKFSPSTFKAPPITVHFAGADIVLNKQNTFIKFGDSLTCFTFNIANNVYIYGSVAQLNFHVGIDKQKKVVSFKPTHCIKLQS
ncbi:hypothetical protein Lal_00031608 [Lupinus albus]|nr:hypothetical protein Lal_00031608 [Lupinus albus]